MSIKRTIYPRPTSRLQMFKVEPRFMFDGAAAVVGAEMLMPDVPESMPVLPEVPVAEVAVPEVAPAPTTEILFIDSAVTDQTTLTANTRAGVEIVTLDAQRDPWQQMTEVIAEYQNLDTVHLVSHASAGQLMFNNESPPFAKGLGGFIRRQCWRGFYF
jgi:hypothetical protein